MLRPEDQDQKPQKAPRDFGVTLLMFAILGFCFAFIGVLYLAVVS